VIYVTGDPTFGLALTWVMRVSLLSTLERRPRPPLILAVLVAGACLIVETLVGVLLSHVAPAELLGLPYLVGLLLIAPFWGMLYGLAMALVSTLVFDFFVLPPVWSLRLTRGDDLVVLGGFAVVVLVVCVLSRLIRLLATEVESREEAGLSAELARLLLRAPELSTVLPATARRLACALDLPSASIDSGTVIPDDDHVAFPLPGDGVRATLVVPRGIPGATMRRLRQRVVPALSVLFEAAQERERVANALRRSRDELARIADEQAALRRLATLVAHTAPAAEVFHAVAREMGRMLGARHTLVVRYEPEGTALTVGTWNNKHDLDATMPIGSRWALEKGTVSELVARTGAPGRVNAYEGDGYLVTRLRARGIRSSVGCPIVVGRSLWGVAIASSSTAQPLPDDTEVRMLEFTELAAAAIANAQSSADLRASRARVVAAADEARRRIERDLHDGTQQRLVSLGLELRGIESAIPAELTELRMQVCRTAKSLDDTVGDLQELSRGLHPAILAKGGLKPALMVLARRSPVPVELDVSIEGRLPQRYEVTVYYVVSEALANTAKHALASVVHVALSARDGLVRLSVRDDGVGGADPTCGSGLIGLTDRVEAAGGRISVVSPPGAGTSVLVEIPVQQL
jgi:signal transduction histidine kinase